MNVGQAFESQGSSLVIRPNRSLQVGGIVVLFVALGGWLLAIGVGFALAGAHAVLPYAGIEVLLLGLLCGWLYRHRDDCELITVEADRVYVVQRRGNGLARHDFSRHWLRVRLEHPRESGGHLRLSVGSHGRFVALGEDIDDAQRVRLAVELQRLLRG